MKPMLSRRKPEVYHYVDGRRVNGPPPDLCGDVTGLSGDVSGLWGDVIDLCGDVTCLRGDVSGLWGDVSGLRGDVSGLRGDVDACELTDAERAAGVHVSRLVASANESEQQC